MKLVAIVGSAVKSGRTRKAVEAVIEAALAIKPDIQTDIVDLAHDRVSILDGRPSEKYEDATVSVIDRVLQGTTFLIASPIYRGTYTGALKNLIDHLPLESFESRPIGLIATGATSHHYLAVDHQFRGLLAWFNSFVLPGSVYLENKDYSSGEIVNADAARHLRELAESLIAVTTALADVRAIPPCLMRQTMEARRA